MRFDGFTCSTPTTYDLLSTRPYLCGHFGKSRSKNIRQLVSGAARGAVTNGRAEATWHRRTRLRRALGVRREKACTSRCRLIQRLALLLSWGQVQDGEDHGEARRAYHHRSAPHPGRRGVPSRTDRKYPFPSSPGLRPAARRSRSWRTANAPSRREPHCKLLHAPAHAEAQGFPGGCAPSLQEIRHPSNVRILIPNRKVSVYLVYVLHLSSPL